MRYRKTRLDLTLSIRSSANTQHEPRKVGLNNYGHPANLSEADLRADPLRLAGVPLSTRSFCSG